MRRTTLIVAAPVLATTLAATGAAFSQPNEYHFQQFAYLVEKLAAAPEGDGTLLDHTALLYGTGISDSNTHFHDDLPVAVVGGPAAGIVGGRYVRHPEGTPIANLYVALLDRLGVHVDSFGDSTGRVETLA